MERSTEPHLIEEAEKILRETRDALGYDSITIFKEDGTFLYSTDPLFHQQENTDPYFVTLDAICYAFAIGVPRTIIFQSADKCLVIKPIFLGVYGEVEAWFFAVGDLRIIMYEEFLDELLGQQKSQMSEEIPAILKSRRINTILQRCYDIPKILGNDVFPKDGLSVTLDGDDGIVTHSLGGSIWGMETKGGRSYPDAIMGLENLDEKIQTKIPFGPFIPPPKPIPKRINYVIKGVNHSRSNILLLLILIFGISPIFLDPYLVSAILFVDLVLLLFLMLSRRGIKTEGISFWCGCSPVPIGILLMLAVFLTKDVQSNEMLFLANFIGIYIILMGILLSVNRWEMRKTGSQLT